MSTGTYAAKRARRAAIFKARAAGISIKQVAAEFGVTAQHVRNACWMMRRDLHVTRPKPAPLPIKSYGIAPEMRAFITSHNRADR